MKLTKRGKQVRTVFIGVVILLIWEMSTASRADNTEVLETAVVHPEPTPDDFINFPKEAWLPETGKAYAQFAMGEYYGWGEEQFACLEKLWNRESNWRWKAKSPTSDYGIPQRHMRNNTKQEIKDFMSDPIEQIRWGLSYIEHRYSTPCKALNHSNLRGWY